MSDKEINDIKNAISLKILLKEYKTFKEGEACNWSKFARNLFEDEDIKEAFIKKVLNK